MDSSKRNTIYSVFGALGFFHMWRRRNRHKLLVLALHGVVAPDGVPDERPLRWQLNPRDLDRYLRVLKRHYRFVSTDDAVNMLRDPAGLRDNCAIVTIDDGYKNTLDVAWPILREHGIRPIVFCATDMVGKPDGYWFDRLDQAIRLYGRDGMVVNVGSQQIVIKRSNRDALRASCIAVITASRQEFELEADRRVGLRGIIDGLFESGPPTSDEARLPTGLETMSAEEVRECVEQGFDVGSHTVSHSRLPFTSDEQLQRELVDSKQILEDITGVECRYFCYPEGSYDARTEKAVQDAGYRAAFSSDKRMDDSADSLFRLGRTHFPDSAGDAELLALTSGFKESLLNVVRRLRGQRSLPVDTRRTSNTSAAG